MTPFSFLQLVWEGQIGYGFLSTKSLTGDWVDHPIELPVKEARIERFLSDFPAKYFDIYFSASTFSTKSRSKFKANPTRWVWADVDDGNTAIFTNCKPFIEWATSKGHTSALWKSSSMNINPKAARIGRYLAKLIGADKGGWDSTQVLRLPGTINHKEGKDNFVVKVISSSTDTYDFSEEYFLSLVDEYKVPQKILKRLSQNVEEGDRSEHLWALEKDLAKLRMHPDIIYEILSISKWNKFHKRPEQLRAEINKAYNEVQAQALSKIEEDFEEEENKADFLFSLDEVEAENIRFLWDPYIPQGKITIIEGDPGLGKSWLTLKIAADLSAGRILPGSKEVEPKKVLLLSAEDGMADTIKPRLISLNAKHSNIFSTNKAIFITDEDIKKVKSLCIMKGIEVIIIDPLVAFMGGKIDLHKANETRSVMARLARLGEETGITTICVRHLTKGGKDKAIYRGIGSIDITGAARSVLAVGRDPSNPHTGRVICHIKSNAIQEGLSLKYSLEKRENPFQFGEFTDDRAQDILATDLHAKARPDNPEHDDSKPRNGKTFGRNFISTEDKEYDWWARKCRIAIRQGRTTSDIQEMVKGARDDVKLRLLREFI